jgi:hypothetical protein
MAIVRVFVDTNVLFEAFRVGAWNRFGRAYSVETVEKCVEETQTGDPSACGRIDIPSQQLTDGLDQIHVPSKKDRATCLLQYPRLQTLDAGEQHLLVWLLSHEKLSDETLCIATADKAAIVACGDLKCLDCVRSFEKLLRDCGTPHEILVRLSKQHQESWLSGVKTKVRLGMIP